ncbi:tumor necrosis factor receptor superfamily member 5 isoform X1 [Micropterus salmoides]|uniref:tumor necrosis factor receptor superfamily member 5 isoform X1 n=1 Tax=Micropterus salmoides TaxID=27706 RepID=UPI0018EB4A2F|nr:tumor necrosis factor receptor superfamily member 5 isoform X1 [Micropterus salmoides]
MLTTQSTKMYLLLMVMWGFMAMTAAQSRCDPQTQYEQGNQCCKMCGPGTSMMSLGTCQEPQCKECGLNEYQETYTNKPKCERQPYCDPNKNFQENVKESKVKKSLCICQVGFHCSSEACITCVPHTTCKPGYEAQSKGNHTHDTVCGKCPKGTFSNESSWYGFCKKWTECQNGYHIQQNGTDISDNICEETKRGHVVVICVVVFMIVAMVVAAFMCLKWRGTRDAKGKVKICVESCLAEKKEPLRECTNVLITTPTDQTDEESTLPEVQTSQEEGFGRTPEENEDELSQEMSTDVVFTENGNFVTQENGKTEILSRQESQTQTFTD